MILTFDLWTSKWGHGSPICSDVNKDLGPKAKAKDTGHKVKAKAKDFGPKAKAKDLRCQSQ